MNPIALIDQYIAQAKIMQIATVKGDQPWICTVYCVPEGHNLYWLSWPTRRHSQEIAAHSKIAIAIAIQTAQPVIGLQAEGNVTEVTDQAEVDRIAAKYVATHGVGKQFAANFAAGTNQHHMYKCTPRKIVLFDEKHFPGEARKEVSL